MAGQDAPLAENVLHDLDLGLLPSWVEQYAVVTAKMIEQPFRRGSSVGVLFKLQKRQVGRAQCAKSFHGGAQVVPKRHRAERRHDRQASATVITRCSNVFCASCFAQAHTSERKQLPLSTE